LIRDSNRAHTWARAPQRWHSCTSDTNDRARTDSDDRPIDITRAQRAPSRSAAHRHAAPPLWTSTARNTGRKHAHTRPQHTWHVVTPHTTVDIDTEAPRVERTPHTHEREGGAEGGWRDSKAEERRVRGGVQVAVCTNLCNDKFWSQRPACTPLPASRRPQHIPAVVGITCSLRLHTQGVAWLHQPSLQPSLHRSQEDRDKISRLHRQ